VIAVPAVAQTAAKTSKALEQQFLAADRNRDGALSRQEIEQAGWLKKETVGTLDKDQSGTVTLEEISVAIAERVQRWLAADTDHDGRVSAAEARSQEDLGGSFGQIDDGDGYATSEELERFGESSYYQAGDLPSVAPNIFERRF
jgi:hypothetical protein